ncbi:hypothetical protein [Gymnodinialimonas hymeniacidonis]|uniref:hypothetical protein n=1 Tax=Gymnodinialimonas hymeniacidonis TaxID=3126508 RepID=UPI0034C6B8EA
MKNIMLSIAAIVGLSTSAFAQGIEPVVTPETDLEVTVGSQSSCDVVNSGIPCEAIVGVAAAAVAIAIIASGDESDGTN